MNCEHDVAIVGAGFAGLTLALQLKGMAPRASVALVDWERRPLPEAAFKIGEATSELGAHYLARKLELQEMLQERHLLKCGLRFFLGDSRKPIAERPEYGPVRFPPVESFQLDRGRLENDLRARCEESGVQLLEGYSVEEIRLGEGGEPHALRIRGRDGGGEMTLRARWTVDCSGRKRLLWKQLGLGAESPLEHSSCWFRVKGRCDLARLVPAENTAWHERVPGGIRFHSTNHLVGRGYWLWLIPLASGNTSVGIVYDERIHDGDAFASHESTMGWLREHEPELARLAGGFEVMDFAGFRRFSYETTRFYSGDRWACVGEAAAFLDPFYSPGADFIALANSFAAGLIVADLAGGLTPKAVDRANAVMLKFQRAFTDVFLNQYSIYGHTRVMTAKVIWDNSSYWVFVCQMFFQDLIFDDAALDRFLELFSRYHELNVRVQKLFRDWAARSSDASGFGHLGYADFEIAVRSHIELGRRRSPKRALAFISENLDRFTAWAVLLFCVAADEIHPEAGGRLDEGWLRPEHIDLDLLDAAVAVSESAGAEDRAPWAREFAGLKRQMGRLFPDRARLGGA